MQNDPSELSHWWDNSPTIATIIGLLILAGKFMQGRFKAEADQRDKDREIKIKELELKKQETAAFVEGIVKRTVEEMSQKTEQRQKDFERKIEEKITQQSARIDEVFVMLNNK